jgi:hypothetical protein
MFSKYKKHGLEKMHSNVFIGIGGIMESIGHRKGKQ